MCRPQIPQSADASLVTDGEAVEVRDARVTEPFGPRHAGHVRVRAPFGVDRHQEAVLLWKEDGGEDDRGGDALLSGSRHKPFAFSCCQGQDRPLPTDHKHCHSPAPPCLKPPLP